jgi:hypothetical protein
MRSQTVVQASIELTSPDLGSLFTIPEADWTAVSKRVGLTRLTEDIADRIAKSLPDFPSLVQVCKIWRETTFPGLIQQSHDVNAYAVQSIASFTALQQKIAGLDPNKPLPPAVKAEAEKSIGTLSTSSATLSTTSASLQAQVANFSSVNHVVDAKITTYVAKLSPQWASIAAPIEAVDRATGRIRGAWQAINNDLQSVVSGKIPITTPFLIGLDIQVSINTWQILRSETAAFASLAQGQDKYLTGQWLIGG